MIFQFILSLGDSFQGMSVQDLLQKDVKQVVGPNIRLLISSLPSEYTVEVKKRKTSMMNHLTFPFFLEIHRTIENYE